MVAMFKLIVRHLICKVVSISSKL